MYYKSIPFETKDIDDSQGIVRVAFSKTGVYDSDNDRLMKGSFTKTIQENRGRIKMFKNHNPNMVPGVIKELSEEGDFAFATMQLSTSTLGKDTLIEYREGIITEHSHGFEGIKGKMSRNDKGGVDFTEVKLWEVSALTHWGANPYTYIDSVKSKGEITNLIQKLDSMIKIGDLSDIALERLENLHKNISNHLEQLKSENKQLETISEEDFASFMKDLKNS